MQGRLASRPYKALRLALSVKIKPGSTGAVACAISSLIMGKIRILPPPDPGRSPGPLPRFAPVGTEAVELAGAVGRVLAEPVAASEAVPGFLRATMDGYAVAARDTFGASVGAPQYLEIKGEVAMGVEPRRGWVPARSCGCPPAACCRLGPTPWS